MQCVLLYVRQTVVLLFVCADVCLTGNGGLRLVFFQAEDGIRDLVRSRVLGDVYKRQVPADQVHTAHDGAERCSEFMARHRDETTL